MSQTIYGQQWNHDMRFMIDSISEEDARRRFERGPWFSAAEGAGLATSPESAREGVVGIPAFALEIEPMAAVVKTFFYDLHGSIWLIYHFTRTEDQLFLDYVTRYEYPDSSRFYRQNKATLIETISYTPEGVTLQAENDRINRRRRITERDQVDVTPHWEPIPEFGDWSGLGRLERA